jgi:hypothetical protein
MRTWLGMPNTIAYFEKDSLTWKELYKVILAWIDYGDDVFDDEYAELVDKLQKTQDEKKRERLQNILYIMDILRDNLYYFK